MKQWSIFLNLLRKFRYYHFHPLLRVSRLGNLKETKRQTPPVHPPVHHGKYIYSGQPRSKISLHGLGSFRLHVGPPARPSRLLFPPRLAFSSSHDLWIKDVLFPLTSALVSSAYSHLFLPGSQITPPLTKTSSPSANINLIPTPLLSLFSSLGPLIS